MRVLVAEDVPITRRVLEETLDAMGHEVVSVGDGNAAWEAFQHTRPRLAILDWLMPGLDGLAVTRRIRATEPRRETFVLLQTGRGTSEDLATALAAGVDDYVCKPITHEHLRARVCIAEGRLELDDAARLAEQALARSRWLAGVGETALAMQHQVNTPLCTLLGELELALEECASEAQRTLLLDAVTQARRVAEVVRRLTALREPTSSEALDGVRMLDLDPTPGTAPA